MLAINMADVVNVLNTCKPYLIGFGIVLVLAVIATIAVHKTQSTRRKLIRSEAGIAVLPALAVTVNLVCWGPMSSLINEAQTLPLAGGNLNVFGWASTNPCYGGTGGGSLSDAYETVRLLEGLEHAGFHTNKELSDFYTAYRAERPEVGMWDFQKRFTARGFFCAVLP